MEFLQANGVVLHHEFRRGGGERPAIVLINSLATDFRIWDKVVDALVETHDVLRYDKRGHGLSGSTGPPYTIEAHAADLAAVMDARGLKRAVICGVSAGGLVAQGLYAARPDLVAALVICSTAHKVGNPDLWNGRIRQAETEGVAALSQATVERWFTPAFRTAQPALVAGIRNMVERTPVAGFTGTLAAIRDADFTQAAPKIAAPALCLAGAEDPAVTPAIVRSLADLIPGSRFQAIEGAAHLPALERPERFLAALRDFLGLSRPG